jgi:uncharacterized membrane protein
VKLSITAYIDLGVIFFSFASLFFLLRWIESGFQSKFIVFSAIMCGLGLGTKYNALITLLLFTLFVPFAYSRYKEDSKPGFFRAASHGIGFLVHCTSGFLTLDGEELPVDKEPHLSILRPRLQSA